MNVYDFDKTIYEGDSTIDFYLFCVKHNPAVLRFLPYQIYGLFAYALKKIPKKKFKEYFFRFLRGINDVDKFVKMFWDQREKHICEWYKNMKCSNDLIISASPEFLLKEICQRLNVNLIGTKVDKHTGIFDSENCHDEEKVNRLYEEYGKDVVIDNFYSDSLSDLPLAKLAKKSFLVKHNVPTDWVDGQQEEQDGFIEAIKYLFFGGLTFLLSVISYSVFINWFNLRPTISNIISWILAVLFAYYTNKKWVFKPSASNSKTKQLISFLIVRLITLLIEEVIIFVFVERLLYPKLIVKIIAQIIVIVLNYIFSKFFVFK